MLRLVLLGLVVVLVACSPDAAPEGLATVGTGQDPTAATATDDGPTGDATDDAGAPTTTAGAATGTFSLDGADATVVEASCDDDPAPGGTEGDVLGVGERVFGATARATDDRDDEFTVTVDRVEVRDDGDLLATYDLATVTGPDGSWEGWSTTGPGADAFASPLDDVVTVDLAIDGATVTFTGDLAMMTDGLPTQETVPASLDLTCGSDGG